LSIGGVGGVYKKNTAGGGFANRALRVSGPLRAADKQGEGFERRTKEALGGSGAIEPKKGLGPVRNHRK